MILAAGVLWLRQTVEAHGLDTSTLMLVAPQLVLGIGLGMMVSPLFDFILASVTDTEVGSASGVLNAVQQLGGAIGVAAIGTLFFSTLAHSGFVTALEPLAAGRAGDDAGAAGADQPAARARPRG